MDRSDKCFDEILLKDIRLNIAEAFLDLEVKMRVNEFTTKNVNPRMLHYINEKANQMKVEINSFIDSQVDRVTKYLNNQGQTEKRDFE